MLLDWALVCEAPPAIEFTFLLMNNPGRFAATRDEMVEDFAAASGSGFDRRALDLAMIGELAGAWHLPLGISDHPAPMVRMFLQAELDWWVTRVRDALARTWSPI